MKQNKICIHLHNIATEISSYISKHPRISRKRRPLLSSPTIKHTVRLSPAKKDTLSNNF